MSLPKFVVFKNTDNDRYLRYIGDDGPIPELVRCSGDEVWSPYAKFEVVTATCNKSLIHLKCCSNNKFLRIYSPTCWWIVAGAEQKDEDISQPTCTLFRPDFILDPGAVRLLHFWSGTFAYAYRRCDGDFTNCLYSGPTLDLNAITFTYVDWEHIVPPKPKNSNIWIGAWGGCEGDDDWSFEVEGEGGITKIIIHSKDVVNALKIESQTADGGTESSLPFGCDEGDEYEIVLEWPKEYLTSIKGTYDRMDCESQITSLEFKTNKGKWTPLFGKKRGTAFALKMKRGAIVGFHGRRSCSFIETIGIFTRHVDEKEPCVVQEIVE